MDAHNLMMQASASYRLQHQGVMIDGTVPLDFDRYPFTTRIIDEHAPRITIIKGAQMGFTIACIMRALEEAKLNKFRGVGYFFPAEGEVSDFAKARFGPMMTNNPTVWGNLVQDTDSASLKRVRDTFLYFRGMGQRGSGSATRSTSKLKSIPLDRLYLDERDEMDDTRVTAAMHRLDGSLEPEVVVLSTPTLPGYGVDLDYQDSDQSVWLWKCQRCNEWSSLELNYPDCIVEPNNKDPYYKCMKCKRPLDRVVGDWVALYPDRSKDHIGYWVSQLSSPTRLARTIVIEAEEAERSGKRKEFENQVLARAYAEIEDAITESQLLDIMRSETKPLRHEGPAAMGVDPGKIMHYEVRVRLNERDTHQIARGSCNSYEELDRIGKKFNVTSGVMDQGFDPTAVGKFVKAHNGWWGCLYVSSKKTEPDWLPKERIVKVGRDWLLDKAHNEILDHSLSLYSKDEGWDEYVKQMTNLKRAVTVNDVSGEEKAQWIVTGGVKNDHLRHAGAYANLACTRVALAKSARKMYDKATKPNKRKRTGMML